MTKAKLKILERIFAAEIHGPFYQQSRTGKLFKELVGDGMIHSTSLTICGVYCKGWSLTTGGHITFCQSCA